MSETEASKVHIKIFVFFAWVFAVLGIMYFGSIVFDTKTERAYTALKYDKEIIEQQQMIINALDSKVKELNTNLTSLQRQANNTIQQLLAQMSPAPKAQESPTTATQSVTGDE